ncbi:ParB N-terminal domain-containing protein [Candidatus Pacearchaeota archaeon]|nr:ParB N-terminal domain-containing protein [Candidatus Pacearchaeota archaeon]
MEINIYEIRIRDRIRKELRDIDDLAESIKEIGLIQPIILTKDNELIAGHRRLLACKKLGSSKIECVKINPKDALHKLDMELAENAKRDDFNPIDLAEGLQKRKEFYESIHPETKAGQFGGWNSATKLEKTESDFSRFTEDTAKKIGKSETFVKEHLQLNDLKPEIKEKIRENKLKKSEALAIFRKNNRMHKIMEEVKELSAEEMGVYEGDCLEQLDKVKDNSVACLIIDHPYGIDFQSNFKLAKHDKIIQDNEEAFSLLDNSLKKVQPKMLKNSHTYIFTHWKVFEFVKPIIEKYFEVKNTLIWNKNNWSMGDLEGNYAEKYEMIIFATQGNRKLLGNKRPINVLDFERTNNSNHPTEKPVNLLKELIKNSTVEGELVLDYFAGSGSTLVASKETNRKFVGIEKDKNYVNVIKGRLKW